LVVGSIPTQGAIKIISLDPLLPFNRWWHLPGSCSTVAVAMVTAASSLEALFLKGCSDATRYNAAQMRSEVN
jgi:hypothetical protein